MIGHFTWKANNVRQMTMAAVIPAASNIDCSSYTRATLPIDKLSHTVNSPRRMKLHGKPLEEKFNLTR